MGRESGQATVEWLALVLLAALIIGGMAAAAGAPAEKDHGLGELIAKRITNAPGAAPRGPRAPAAGRPAPQLRGVVPLTAPRAPASGTRPRAPAPRRPLPARAVDAFRRLRGVATIARRAWIVCLGYRRWRYELAHPRLPTEPLPLGDALAIVNDCLNPYGFLLED